MREIEFKYEKNNPYKLADYVCNKLKFFINEINDIKSEKHKKFAEELIGRASSTLPIKIAKRNASMIVCVVEKRILLFIVKPFRQ